MSVDSLTRRGEVVCVGDYLRVEEIGDEDVAGAHVLGGVSGRDSGRGFGWG